MNIGMMLSPNMSFVKGGARMDLKPNSFQGQSINSAFRSLLVESVTSKNTSADIAAPSNFLTELFGA